MARVERVILGLGLGLVAPVTLTLLLLTLAIYAGVSDYAPYAGMTGIALGLVIDALVLPPLVRHAYDLPLLALFALLLFFEVGTYGFFMGMPAGNIVPGVVAAAFMGRRLRHRQVVGAALDAQSRRTIRVVGAALLLACLGSAAIALLQPSTASEVQHMLGLRVPITPTVLWGIILVGGGGLLLVQTILARRALRWAYSWA